MATKTSMKTSYVDNTLRTEMPNFLTSLETGRIRWDLLSPFPQEDPADAKRAEELSAEIGEFVESRIDPTEVDLTGELPAELIEGYRERRYNKLLAAKELDGYGLPPYSVYRIMQRLTSISTPAAQVVGIANTVGATMMLPALLDNEAEGPLREWISQRVKDGIICAFGDSDPDGQNNHFAPLKVVPAADGSDFYEVTGRKLFTANGPIFDVIGVSATLEVDGKRSVVFPFVESTDPGFSVSSRVEFMGSKGLPSGALNFDTVRIPKWRVLHDIEEPSVLRRLSPVALAGRVMSVSAPVTGIAKMCLKWSRDFVNKRRIDGVPLGEFEAIQRRVATTAAEIYAMETAAQWCLLGEATEHRWFEQLLTKNISTEHAWRIVDRTVSLLGGRGFETARSKARRGEEPVPLERYFRDARGFRIVANVDFQLDNQTGFMLLGRFYQGDADTLVNESGPGPDITKGTDLNAANAAHLQEAARQVRQFATACRDLVTRFPDPQVMYTKEDTLITVGRITGELFTVCAVLARTSTMAGKGVDYQDLADIACSEAFDRLAGLWRSLNADTAPDFAGTTRRWLSGSDETLNALAEF